METLHLEVYWQNMYNKQRVIMCVHFVTHVPPACCVLDFVQGATFSLNVAEVQFNTWDHDLGMTNNEH